MPGAATTPRQRALAALADELTPTKSLARLDVATARVVSSVTLVTALLTGLGLVAVGLPATAGAPRTLATVSVGLAFLAVLCALAAQVLTVSQGVNPNNLKDVERWYRRVFAYRAPLASAASALMVAAAAVAGTAALGTLTAARGDRPTFAVTRTAELPVPTETPTLATPPAPAADAPGAAATRGTVVRAGTVVVEVTFRGLAADQVLTVTVTVDDTRAAQAALIPGPEGAATQTLTVVHVPAQAVVTVDAWADPTTCTASLAPGQPTRATCTPP